MTALRSTSSGNTRLGREGRLALIALTAVATVGCVETREPEPVRFAPFGPAAFAEGGTLTDAWADFDLDGDPDRFVGFNGTASRLYRNDLVNGFTDVATEHGIVVTRAVRTSAWGDFDGDGDPDLLLGYAGEAPVTALYRNDRADGFVDVAREVGLELSEGTTRQASWIDYDEDGDLDLFLAMRDRGNLLFENRGDRGFVERGAELGLDDPRRTVGAAWFDIGDGRLDLLVGNMNGDANALFVAAPAGGYEELDDGLIHAGGRALGDDAQGTVRPCVVDFDSDGDLDLFFANYGPNGLLERDGDTWRDVGAELGLANDSRYDTCAWGDFDNDGSIDLYVNGTVGGDTHYRDWLMRREGSEVFVDVTPPELLGLNASHGVTWVDFDLDGDLDLALAGAADNGTHLLMQNLLRPEYAWHSLQIRVLDGQGRSSRPGAEVRLFAAGTRSVLGTRLVDSGSGYDAQSDLPVHFGVPGGQPVDVEVTVFADGERRTALVSGVDPRDHRGSVLELRIDAAGRVNE